jgi:hypothetical protein
MYVAEETFLNKQRNKKQETRRMVRALKIFTEL